MSEKQHGLGERVADAARHVVEALEQDVESLALTTPAEAIAEAAAAARAAPTREPDKADSRSHRREQGKSRRDSHHR